MKKGDKIFYTLFDDWGNNPKTIKGEIVEYSIGSSQMKIKANFSDFWNKVEDSEVWVLKGSCRLQNNE